MTLQARNKSDVKPWLEKLLKHENIENFDFTISGNSGKGDGYMGDIVFVEVCGRSNGQPKKYSLVLKCSKRSEALREKSPVKEAFLSEIYFYDVVFPTFKKFQQERNVAEPFEKVPKCYGTLVSDNTEVLALENLKTKGYFLWDRTKPLFRRNVDLVIREYGKYHAVSMAMQDQEPDKFEWLIGPLDDVLRRFCETSNEMFSTMENSVEELYELLEGELEQQVLEKWRELKQHVEPFFTRVCQPLEGRNVIIHGDCWGNNFMHYNENGEPAAIAILDWQLMKYSSPILDLSYFLFSCISEEDINDMEDILRYYHECLTEHLEKLGSSKSLYTIEQLFEDWRKYNKFGVLLVMIIHKFCLSEEHDVPDMAAAAEKGEDIITTFAKPIKSVDKYKKRMKYIMQYVVENNVI